MNWDVATSGWLPALISSVLSLFGLGKNKELKKNKKNLQANIGGDNYAINADTVIFTDETLKNEKADSSLKQIKEESRLSQLHHPDGLRQIPSGQGRRRLSPASRKNFANRQCRATKTFPLHQSALQDGNERFRFI